MTHYYNENDPKAAAWHGSKAYVSQCTLRYIDGELDAKSKKLLDKKYNMEA